MFIGQPSSRMFGLLHQEASKTCQRGGERRQAPTEALRWGCHGGQGGATVHSPNLLNSPLQGTQEPWRKFSPICVESQYVYCKR